MILDVLNLLVVLSELLMLYILSCGIFSRKIGKKEDFVLFILLLCCTFATTELIGNFAVIKSIVICFIFTCWMKLAHEVQWAPCFFVAIFFQAYVYLADSGVLFLISYGLEIEPSALLSSPSTFYLVVLLAKCLEYFGILAIRSVAKKRLNYSCNAWSDWIHTAVLPVATLLLGIVLLYIYKKYPLLSQDLLLCAIILLLTNFFSFFLLEKLESRQTYIRDNALLQQNLMKEKANLSLWEEAFKSQRKQTHDFQNHLIVLRGMVEKECLASTVSTYINSIIQESSFAGLQISTHRAVIDIILNQKYALAKQHDIDFMMHLDDLSAFPLPDDALTVVLTNLLDNAISAASKVTGPQGKCIKIKMDMSEEVGFLFIENTTEHPVLIQNNHVITKNDPLALHGYGLQNVRTILDRFDADYVFDYSGPDKLFVFSAQIMRNGPQNNT